MTEQRQSVMAPAAATGAHNPVIWLTICAFFSFFVFGFVDNLKGPVLPVLLRDLEFSYSRGGTMLLGAYLGFLVATIATGLLADRVGNRVILIAAGTLMTAGIVLFSRGSLFVALAGGMVLIGLGMGAIEVGGNGLIVELHSRNRGRFLNLLAVFHGIGSTIVPVYAAVMLTNAFTWRQVYLTAVVLSVGLTLLFLFARYRPAAAASMDGLSLTALRSAGFSPRMRWYYLLITVYVAAELGIAAWVVEFMQQSKGLSLARGSFYLSLFFGMVMLGRLIGSVVVERIGYLRVMLMAGSAAVVTLSLGIFGPPSTAIFVPLTGLFFSIIFPTTTAAVSQEHPQRTGTMLGLLFAAGGLGGAVGPWLMGVVNDLAGVTAGFALTVGYCVTMMLALLMLRQLDRVQP